ncbi:MAG TPA: TIGR04283 family arsenosugar biosynthesis glycosyltransferase [Methylomirabilota bacterium]|jgi:rSAM/selenodomain-associated transferase 2|nr:TIGR04283 family arsenosugar biosynthesis glycosyltransferase [Methylomirabilota bacterium]
MAAWCSIVIPARHDAAALGRTLDALERLEDRAGAEIVVAASGDPEGTTRAAAGRGRLLWPQGSTRAALMNAGAAAATGRVLLFLHADSVPPPDALARIASALADPRAGGGAFAHRFAEPVWSLRAISLIDRARYRLTRNWYGDQGIFVRAEVFRALGGYRDLRLMEDLDFSQRLKRRGRSVLVNVPVVTSGRRFLARGPWRTFFFIVWLLARWTVGLDTERYAERWRGPADAAPGSSWRERPADR